MSITSLLQIKYPIIQGAMANISLAPLVSAVSNAGGLGVIGTGSFTGDQLREEIKKCRELTTQPFAVNLMLLNPHRDELVDVVIEEGIKIVTTGAGSPGEYMSRFKEADIKVIPVVPTVALAKRMQRLGADALIVEGTEAGGHVGETTTLTLVPQVVDAVDIPVIAAGGIADGRGMLAAYALGADAVQVGTRFLTATECPIHDQYKAAILKAKDSDTVVTGRSAGAPVRCLKNAMTRQYKELEKQGVTTEELERLTLGSLKKAVVEGDIKQGSVMAGQVSGLVSKIQTSEEIILDLMQDLTQAYQALSHKK